jgi:hypothetical protein
MPRYQYPLTWEILRLIWTRGRQPKFEEIGAGVSFGPNATRALGLMGGLDKDYLAIADSTPGDNKNLWFQFRMFDDDHELLTTVKSHKYLPVDHRY